MPAEIIDGKPTLFKRITVSTVEMGLKDKEGRKAKGTAIAGMLEINEGKFIFAANELDWMAKECAATAAELRRLHAKEREDAR